ncbi:MAG: hypothetical protein IH860_02930 [Chloroflexi bacterium]|nr:hypothetical protein [Chloroflexota bacterium]
MPFTEVDVSRDGKARYRIKKLTGRARTPVFIIGGYVVSDFNRHRLDKPLEGEEGR